ncbi:hypothetical protein K439DRAFT_1637710 [Ramaria rubella]|nr:hypothetical protein K439DRAFT_1637710 [Ramaria rubella]
MTLSTVGSARFKVYGALLLVNTVVLGLSGHINHFQAFFYKADVFPLALSVSTTIFVLTMILLDINLKNAFTARPPFELAWLFILGILWLAFNAFSTSRWKYANTGLCGTIPSDAQYAPYRTWCHELQALRVFVWIEWVMILFTFAYLVRWTLRKHHSGRHDVWTTAFSRFVERDPPQRPFREATNSEFLQWEKFPQTAAQPQDQFTQPSQDPFAVPSQQFHPYSQDEYDQYVEGLYTQVQPSQYMEQQRAHYVPPSQTQHALSENTYFTEAPQVI